MQAASTCASAIGSAPRNIRWRMNHGEGGGVGPVQQVGVADAGDPEEVAPAALEIAQVVGVVDDAGEVGVLVVDPDREHVLAAFEPAGGGVAHRRSLTRA